MIPFPFQAGGFGLASVVAAGGGGGGAVTWNPADKSADLTLSSGDLVVSHTTTGEFDSARATLSRSSGHYYFEVELTGSGSDQVIGVADSGMSVNSYVGSSAGSYGYYQASGQKLNNGSPSAYGASFIGAAVIGVEVDFAAGEIFFYKDGSIQNGGTAAFTGVSGSLFPAVTLFQNAITAIGKFKAADLTYSLPTGASAWES